MMGYRNPATGTDSVAPLVSDRELRLSSVGEGYAVEVIEVSVDFPKAEFPVELFPSRNQHQH